MQTTLSDKTIHEFILYFLPSLLAGKEVLFRLDKCSEKDKKDMIFNAILDSITYVKGLLNGFNICLEKYKIQEISAEDKENLDSDIKCLAGFINQESFQEFAGLMIVLVSKNFSRI